MVVFREFPPFAEFIVRCSQFTSDMKEFRSWLGSTQFGEGGFAYNSSKIVEGVCAAYKVK
jgi:hypothetical protein